MSAGGRIWGQSSIVTEEQDTTQVPASLTDSSEGPVSREALYEMVWSEPMLRVAARFGVSSSYMARVCTLLNVPRPERGYWAKLAVGKAPKQPPLPEPRPGDPLEWTRDGALPKRARSLPKPPDQRPRGKRTVKRQLPDRHQLVSGAKPLFEAGRLHHNRVFNLLKTHEKAPSAALFSYPNQANTFSSRVSRHIALYPAFAPLPGVFLGVQNTPS